MMARLPYLDIWNIIIPYLKCIMMARLPYFDCYDDIWSIIIPYLKCIMMAFRYLKYHHPIFEVYNDGKAPIFRYLEYHHPIFEVCYDGKAPIVGVVTLREPPLAHWEFSHLLPHNARKI